MHPCFGFWDRYPARNGLIFSLLNADLACYFTAELCVRASRKARTRSFQRRMRFRIAIQYYTLFTLRRNHLTQKTPTWLGEFQVSSVSLQISLTKLIASFYGQGKW